ncbi:MAG: S53 family peptidase [Bryobacteraceae bacterium]|jgi:subtilase family serine protease
MRKRLGVAALSVPVLAFLFAFPFSLAAQSRGERVLITQPINENVLHRLAGNTRPQATAENDAGPVPDSLSMEHMLLQMQRPAGRETALRQLIDSLHNPKSPNYHHWLKAAEFGQAFGPAPEDVTAVTDWLQSHGFQINVVYPSGMLIDFSGTAGQVRFAFHTAIHYLDVNGSRHVANMSDPQIPEALAPAVAGVVSLHDFQPRAMKRARVGFTFSSGGNAFQALSPSDLATIYNLNPLFAAGTAGQGQTIAVLEDSDLYSTADWDTFRSTFGLSQYASGTLTTVHPAPASGANNCLAPGVLAGDDGESILDAEWSSAAAPAATIMVAACASTRTTFGGLIAMQNLLNSAAGPPSIMSISYGECEAGNGASANAAYNSTFQQAVAEGVSVFVAAGDEGAASCDAGASGATHGIGVSAFASTPYNVAVGGTDFGDSVANTNSSYWNSTNTTTYGSAVSYIPEIPWNDSCAGSLLSGYFGYSLSYGATGFCASNAARQYSLQEVVGGSGGPSGCATGSPSASVVVSGTCQGYAKPDWQTALTGVPNDGVRDLPDVSLFAGDGIWGHYYVMCWSDVRNGGARCTGDPSTWAGAGGTSFASPIMAGIQALVNQNTGSAQGNPNYVYYQLAANEYGAAGSSICNSINGSGVDAGCVFYNVTQGDNAVNCAGDQNCFGSTASATRGRRSVVSATGGLSTAGDSYAPAYGAGIGWNFATGIGTVNAYNLVTNWITGQ